MTYKKKNLNKCCTNLKDEEKNKNNRVAFVNFTLLICGTAKAKIEA